MTWWQEARELGHFILPPIVREEQFLTLLTLFTLLKSLCPQSLRHDGHKTVFLLLSIFIGCC